jgi:predicted outer membrane repeat protein
VPALIYSDTFDWLGLATIEVTVTEDAPGFEGLYRWNYRVSNEGVGPADGIEMFSISVGNPADIGNMGTSQSGWTSSTEFQGAPGQIGWQGGPGLDLLQIGEWADFWFTTLPTSIREYGGFVASPEFYAGAEGPIVAPFPAIVVNTDDDAVNADQWTSLREAIEIANGPQNLGGQQRITFAADYWIVLDWTLPILEKDIFIDGAGKEIVIDRDVDDAEFRLLEVKNTSTSKIFWLTFQNGDVSSDLLNGSGGAILSNGNLTIIDCLFQDNAAFGGGGAIIAAGGSLTVSGSDFFENEAAKGGAIAANSGVSVTISDSWFFSNRSFQMGGAIYFVGGTTENPATLTLDAVTLSYNTAVTFGGAVYCDTNSNLVLKGGTSIHHNSVTGANGKGGGVYIKGNASTINYLSVSIGDNTAAGGRNVYRVNGVTRVDGMPGVNFYDGHNETVGP